MAPWLAPFELASAFYGKNLKPKKGDPYEALAL
jgi:hypothetical protein